MMACNVTGGTVLPEDCPGGPFCLGEIVPRGEDRISCDRGLLTEGGPSYYKFSCTRRKIKHHILGRGMTGFTPMTGFTSRMAAKCVMWGVIPVIVIGEVT